MKPPSGARLPKRAGGYASIYDAALRLKRTPTAHRRTIKLFADHFTIFPTNSPTLYVDYAINFYQLKKNLHALTHVDIVLTLYGVIARNYERYFRRFVKSTTSSSIFS